MIGVVVVLVVVVMVERHGRASWSSDAVAAPSKAGEKKSWQLIDVLRTAGASYGSRQMALRVMRIAHRQTETRGPAAGLSTWRATDPAAPYRRSGWRQTAR
jgi:hypothetical protein